MTDSLLKEVDDALRVDRMQQLWQRSGRQITVTISLVVISLIALLIYQQQQRQQAQAYSDQLLTLMNGEKLPEDAKPLTGSYAQLAALLRAEPESAITPLGEGASKALAHHACLQKRATNPSEPSSCQLDAGHSPLTLEYEVLRAIAADNLAGAYAMLPKQSTHLAERLVMLRDYLRSHAPELDLPELPADADATSHTQP